MIQDNVVQKLCNIKTGFETATRPSERSCIYSVLSGHLFGHIQILWSYKILRFQALILGRHLYQQ